jgi:sulfoxide reductase catalytic subunit YedY
LIIKTKKEIRGSEITDPGVFKERRKILKALASSLVVGTGIPLLLADTKAGWNELPEASISNASLQPTAANLVKQYTNYYEFSIDKEESSQLAKNLKIDPWSVEIVGEIEKPSTFHLEDLLSRQNLQEFIYRHRCVEGWSMVVPWIGFQLGDLLKSVKPLSAAKFVKFTAISQQETMPSQAQNILLEWPYVEGLRMDEAMHPLAILAVGMYGEKLPNQNGAPLRLVVPWKYGFKSIKAIVKIELVKTAPMTSWAKAAPKDYGFYANVNPNVPHPRWSQASERQLGNHFFTPRRQTELFNGYAEQVASMYSDLDLRHFY